MTRDWKPALRRPVIYAFSIPARPGDIKVGETTRKVADRIPEYLKQYGYDPEAFTVLAEVPAISGNGILKDHDIHKVLEHHLGCHRYPGEEREWFRATKQNLTRAIKAVELGEIVPAERHQIFGLRPEQAAAVERTASYFTSHANPETPLHFLWNAKMRFGKTFTAYKLAEKMGWSKVLVLTYKPAVEDAWREDLETHADFAGWTFIGNRAEQPAFGDRTVWFSSFQALFSEEGKGRLAPVFETKWDAIILDEYHFGADKDRAADLMKDIVVDASEATEDLNLERRIASGDAGIKADHFLHLSGTPFRALVTGEFTEDQIFSWTYTDEQRAKRLWRDADGANPYEALPQMVMMTYKLPEGILAEFTEEELNLDKFFSAKETTDVDAAGNRVCAFEDPDRIRIWLDFITGSGLSRDELIEDEKNKSPMPYKDARIFPYINHSLWYLPSVAACKAMAELLRRNHVLSNYEVVIAAGPEAGIGLDALPPVREAIKRSKRTITLSCGKLTTGVTVPEWTSVFMLRSMKSPESYFQTAFRAQSPGYVFHGAGKSETAVMKDTCFVFDFDPRRALTLASEYCYQLDRVTSGKDTTRGDLLDRMGEFLDYMPVLCHDNGMMLELDPGAAIDLATSGIGTAMLARRFQSPKMVDVSALAVRRLQEDTELVAALARIEAFRNLSENLKAITAEHEKKGHLDPEGEPKEKEKKPQPVDADIKKMIKEIQDNLLKFVTRLPVFMYLNDEREKTALEVIATTDDALFKKATGITKADFRKLLDLGVFQADYMNEAIRSFKQVEDNALVYLGDREIKGASVAAWDTHVDRIG